ncbi:energy-coupling factor ABC transporter ATP-binding protein [Brevibacillus laterosporus]|uniref:energy-coupling factor ABC transporter ATP-binding protein n=1 Tax=Brevibacillus laterosporus TaxID=1465 RepID=UPI000B9A2518|nr:ATP-binding cassette domain-containing protein [Brevibacillus laterosporus]MCG7317082.1 ATP-binding cassette domain-containing protein [Brevibacillus laterosporus]
MSHIEINQLKYRYPMSEQLALDGVSMTVQRGEFLGVIGQNRAGKSTFCQALTGLVPHFYKGAYGGSVLIDGTDVGKEGIDETIRKVGIVFQNPFTQVTGAKLTVYEEIAFGLEHLGVPRQQMIERIDHVLHLLDIEECKDRAPFDLSGGQMQRMAIASVIAMRPQVIVLDEPTSQLDPQGSEEVFLAIQSLSKEGMTVILAEHKMEKLAVYADRIALFHQGKLIDVDTPSRLFSRDDLAQYDIQPPVYTRVCRELGLRLPGANTYPVTLEEAQRSYEAHQQQNRQKPAEAKRIQDSSAITNEAKQHYGQNRSQSNEGDQHD